MKENKGFILAAAVVVLILAAALIWRYGRSKTEIDREIACVDVKSGAEATVSVKGTYHDYWLRRDVFDGEISVRGGLGYLANRREFEFRNGEASLVETTYGQPVAAVRQTGVFQTIEIISNEFDIRSK